jgi:hypothetical protein
MRPLLQCRLSTARKDEPLEKAVKAEAELRPCSVGLIKQLVALHIAVEVVLF